VSAIMGRLLGWNRRKRATETRRYLDLVESEQAVIGMDTGQVPEVALTASAR